MRDDVIGVPMTPDEPSPLGQRMRNEPLFKCIAIEVDNRVRINDQPLRIAIWKIEPFRMNPVTQEVE